MMLLQCITSQENNSSEVDRITEPGLVRRDAGAWSDSDNFDGMQQFVTGYDPVQGTVTFVVNYVGN